MVYVLIYCAAMVGANLFVAWFGPWISPLNAFVLIGLDLSLRDKLHDRWAGRNLWLRMLALIVGSGALSYVFNPAAGKIAIASVVAFVVAGLADAIAYHLLRRCSYLQRSIGSNVVGAIVDSIIFPTLAFGSVMPGIIALQIGAKIGGSTIWALALRPRAQAAA